METACIKNDIGTIHIANQVIAVLARDVVLTVDEVIEMNSRYFSVFYTVMDENETKGVRVSVKNNMVIIDLFICVKHGLRIPAIALKIQKVVKENIESALHVVVSEVNVNIQRIIFDENRC